jgi:hypothetical protein
MKRALIIAAALGVLSLPALAQGITPSGTRAGGPAQMGAPGEVGAPGGARKMSMAPRKMKMKKSRAMKRKKMM